MRRTHLHSTVNLQASGEWAVKPDECCPPATGLKMYLFVLDAGLSHRGECDREKRLILAKLAEHSRFLNQSHVLRRAKFNRGVLERSKPNQKDMRPHWRHAS